ncbi:hypothetical protein [Burkholderia cepacia]|uniref:hypothetical protein n=1 Tax=Burkholderia cepacia TaxID=292 RepID=UPI001E3784E6|nr:hypothetical protein [Burkholderia cepacia]
MTALSELLRCAEPGETGADNAYVDSLSSAHDEALESFHKMMFAELDADMNTPLNSVLP